MLARFLSDPVWLFYTLWLPKYLKSARGFDLHEIVLFAWVPFLAADFGSIFGGFLSASFIKRGYPVVKSRKIAMCMSAALMPVAIPAVLTPSWPLALLFISVAAFGHQSWAASLLTLPTDLFPKRMVASAYGLSGMLGIFGGALFQLAIGGMVDALGYTPVFMIVGFMHPLAAVVIVVGTRSAKSKCSP